MDEYVTKLLSNLNSFKVLIDNKLYDHSKKEDVKNIVSLINDLNKRYKEKRDLDTFDYSTLRKKVCFVFHPDVYKIEVPQDLNINTANLVSSLNGNVESINKGTKNGEQFYYDYTVEKKEESKKQEQKKEKQDSPKTERHYRTEQHKSDYER